MWTTFFYEPIYNAFIFILSLLPNHNVGIAVILLTLVIKIILYPLYQKSFYSQQILNKINPEIREIQEKYKDSREELGRKTLEIYRKYKVNPFSSLFIIILQIPIFIALYQVFSHNIHDLSQNLYSFIEKPEKINEFFLGHDLTKPFWFFALAAAYVQHIQAKGNFPKKEEEVAPVKKDVTFADELAKNMRVQIVYFLPLFIAVIGLTLPSAITLYFLVSNIFSLLQELHIKKQIKKEAL
jgi:YidC/Oxa1 family membrane protein insertase